jgi:putative endonuclease
MSELLTLHLEDNDSAETNSSAVGRIGEETARLFLLKNGYRLVTANFKAPIGRNSRGATVEGEIDLIALDGDVLCFVEVKTRSSDDFASPLAAIDLRKQRQIIRTARVYRKIFDVRAVKFRYDAVSVVLADRERPKIELFRNFWTEDKFRKKAWEIQAETEAVRERVSR